MSEKNDKDFSDQTSIGEMHVFAANDSKFWTPREALIHVLRRIDKGEINPDALTIVWRAKPDESVWRVSAAPTRQASIAMLAEAFARSVYEGPKGKDL